MTRTAILERFRRKVAEGRPIIGGGAGTGLSAKCAEAGGIDDCAEATDYAAGDQPFDSHLARRLGQADAGGEIGDRDSAIDPQNFDDLAVERVKITVIEDILAHLTCSNCDMRAKI